MELSHIPSDCLESARKQEEDRAEKGMPEQICINRVSEHLRVAMVLVFSPFYSVSILSLLRIVGKHVRVIYCFTLSLTTVGGQGETAEARRFEASELAWCSCNLNFCFCLGQGLLLLIQILRKIHFAFSLKNLDEAETQEALTKIRERERGKGCCITKKKVSAAVFN